jgi:alpha-beta hydrolase superfamily lysophospholipase
MGTELTKTTYDGIMLKGRVDRPTESKASVVIIHGLCEHYGRYDYLTSRLNAQGYTVYRFDHRGHGRSEGKSVWYDDREQIVKDSDLFAELALVESAGTPVFMLGHSMGGWATAMYATTFPGKLAGYVLSGALTRDNGNLAGALPADAPNDSYVPNALGSGVCSDPGVVERYAEDPLVKKEISVSLFRAVADGCVWLKENPKAFVDPVLIMHGANDGLVSPKDSLQLYDEIASTDKSLRIYAGFMHEIFNEYKKDRVIRDTLEWLDDHTA